MHDRIGPLNCLFGQQHCFRPRHALRFLVELARELVERLELFELQAVLPRVDVPVEVVLIRVAPD
eukprot:2142636-Rhodomonas_salina.1